MKPIIAIVGESGTGKSTSFRTLNPDTTFIIKCINKPLPFPHAAKYKDGVNTKHTMDWKEIIRTIKLVNDNSQFKVLIIDDLGHVMSHEYLTRAGEDGWERFTEIGQHTYLILQALLQTRDDLKIVITFHSEVLITSDGKIHRKIRTIGNLLESRATIEGIFTVILYSNVNEDENDNITYQFVTNKTKGYPAKSPMGMFPLYVENDLAKIIETFSNYYKNQ